MIIIEDPAGTISPEERERYRVLVRERLGDGERVVVITSRLADDGGNLQPGRIGVDLSGLREERSVLAVPDIGMMLENRFARRRRLRRQRRAEGRQTVGKGLR